MKTAEEKKQYEILAECNFTSKSALYKNRNIGTLMAPRNCIKAMDKYAIYKIKEFAEYIDQSGEPFIKPYIDEYLQSRQ